MSSTRCRSAVNAFAIDAFCISMELYAVCERDAPGIRTAAIRKGRQSYKKLIQRRKSLSLSADDASRSESMLKDIEARLEYLCAISTSRRNQWRSRGRNQAGMYDSEVVDMRWLWKGLQCGIKWRDLR